MKDIKVFETINQMIQDDKIIGHLFKKIHHPTVLFAEAVAFTRQEPGVSIKEIAKCFKAQFDEEELKSLIRELSHD